MRAPLIVIPLLLCLGLALYGCSSFRHKQAPESPALAFAGGPAVGRPAPEIEGADLNGVRFKLSDYRGKVVVLDFWGNW